VVDVRPPGSDAGEDRAALADFLSEVQGVLGEMLEYPEWFSEELHELLRAALGDVAPRIELVQRYLTDPHDADVLDARLAEAGLTGVQLELKLRGFRGALERFREEP